MKENFYKVNSKLNVDVDSICDPVSNGYLFHKFYQFIHTDRIPTVNFAINDYLALSNEKRIKNAIKDLFRDGDVSSKVQNKTFKKAEEYLSWIYDKPILLYTSSILAHNAVIQNIIEANDAIIFDNLVHSNLKFFGEHLKTTRHHTEKIQHNCISALEERIVYLTKHHSKVWYIADSIYPISGDVISINEIKRLLAKYEQFYVYIDDSKGMSWIGENGKGYILNNMDHPKVVLSISLSKGFGCQGGVIVCHNDEIRNQISKQVEFDRFKTNKEHSILNAIIESSKIHLSNEIYTRQLELREKIVFLNEFAKNLGLPIICEDKIPTAFFLMRNPEISQEIRFKLFQKGYYLNVANFPAVSYSNSGITANVTLYQSINSIKIMLKTLDSEYRKVLKKKKMEPENICTKCKTQELPFKSFLKF